MSKKMMMLALAVVSAALFALPAVASAQSWHLSQTTSFSVTGSGGNFSTSAGTTISCTSTTGAGSFSTTTEGSVSITFHGCLLAGLGAACTTPGQSAGTIAVSYKFDAIMFATNKPALLLTQNGVSSTELTPGQKFVTEISCFGVSTKVYGKGSIATIHSPANACGATGSTWGINFEKSAHGVQKHQLWTGTAYDTITNAASHPTAALEGTSTMHFPVARTLICTHVA
jgi:hypothetical protein